MAALAAVTAGAGLANIAASLGSAGIQSDTSLKLQQNEQKFNTGVMDRAEKAYTDVGLPKYEAYSGNSGGTHLPGQQFHVTGSNFYSAGLVGQSVPFLSTPYQSFTHTGRPNTSVNQTTQTNKPTTGTMTKNNGPSTSRAGLGMYSQVRPWNEPQAVNELGDTNYRNMSINRNYLSAVINNPNNNDQQQGTSMQTIPKSIFTRTRFGTYTPLQNYIRPDNYEAHRQAASILQ